MAPILTKKLSELEVLGSHEKFKCKNVQLQSNVVSMNRAGRRDGMKKIMLTAILLVTICCVRGQEITAGFIDSAAERHILCTTVLLFSKIIDTIDNQTGRAYTKRVSVYYDRSHNQLRDVDVYNFGKKIKARRINRAFRRQKQIPASTHIVYTFLNCSLVKVRVENTNCVDCLGEYYFSGGTLFQKRERNFTYPKMNFVNESHYILAKLNSFDSDIVQCLRKASQ